MPDARAIGDDLAARRIQLSLGGQVYDPTDPMGKMFYSTLAIFAEFEVDLLRARTKEGMAVARAKGKLRGSAPKLSTKQPRELVRMSTRHSPLPAASSAPRTPSQPRPHSRTPTSSTTPPPSPRP
jgi:DNA invertase Pin-like site-specific DNA recombinase